MSAHEPLRILFLISSLETGGAERQLGVLASGLVGRGHHVTLVVSRGGAMDAELTGVGVAVVNLERRTIGDAREALSRLARTVRAFRPDIIHGYLPAGNLAALWARRAWKPARVIWGVRASDLDWGQYGMRARLAFMATCRLAARADAIIANSEAGARWHVAHGYPAGRMHVVPNGIDASRFVSNPEARARWRSAWGVAEDVPLVGLVGRLDPMKDHPTFLRAAARIPAPARFVCIGAGDARAGATLRSLAADLGVAHRVTWVPSAPMTEAYSALDVLASTSAYGEGFPNVVGEAMACGVPCVVTRCGDAPTLVGDTGRVVDVGDAAAVAAACMALLAADRAALGCAARERVVRCFGVDRLVERSEDVFRALEREERGTVA
jgi:glycosyltransferase involved in cell wall biosynthesis